MEILAFGSSYMLHRRLLASSERSHSLRLHVKLAINMQACGSTDGIKQKDGIKQIVDSQPWWQ